MTAHPGMTAHRWMTAHPWRQRIRGWRRHSRMIEASAPGKLVVSGEYAVLTGAPALVAAVDRRVSCVLSPRSDGGWRFVSRGFVGDVSLSKAEVFQPPDSRGPSNRGPDSAVPGIFRRVLAASAAPEHLHVEIDSSPCYLGDRKLGIGSSAATVTAVATAGAALGGDSPGLERLYAIHADFQGGGSGLDVAAAVTGGVIRFQNRRVNRAELPAVSMAFVFTGSSTRTRELLARFEAWRRDGTPAALERLALAALAVADCTVNAEAFTAALGEYVEVLKRFDRAGRLGVFGPGHRRAAELAERCGVVYKPCGAGGGDTGMAVAVQADAVAAFARAARIAGLTIIPMEISGDGVTIRTG